MLSEHGNPSNQGNDPKDFYAAMHDGRVHDPLGSGSYIFQKDYVSSLMRCMGLPLLDSTYAASQLSTTAIIHVGAQPNNSPHTGTMVVFILAFLIARDIKKFYAELAAKGTLSPQFITWIDDLEIIIHVDLVDTAPHNGSGRECDGISYQRSQRHTQAHHSLLPDYKEIIQSAADFVGGTVPYEFKNQESLTTMPSIPRIIDALVQERERLGPELAPTTQVLAMRCACPHEGCGLAEKHGRKNQYSVDAASGIAMISFYCPDHGYHTVTTSNPADVARLEFNTPLRNLVRAFAFGTDTTESRKAGSSSLPTALAGMETVEVRERVHMRVTGSDYAGTYSEQLLWRQLLLFSSTPGLGPIPPPVIVYAPLVQDWAGSKLSKSLYVKEGAYEYLYATGMHYMLSFDKMKKSGRDIRVLFAEVARWLEEPKKLFRPYSIDYIHRVFQKENATKQD